MTRLGFCTLLAVLINGFSELFAAVVLGALGYGIVVAVIAISYSIRMGCLL